MRFQHLTKAKLLQIVNLQERISEIDSTLLGENEKMIHLLTEQSVLQNQMIKLLKSSNKRTVGQVGKGVSLQP